MIIPFRLSRTQLAAQRQARQAFWAREYRYESRSRKFVNAALAIILLTAVFFTMAMLWIGE